MAHKKFLKNTFIFLFLGFVIFQYIFNSNEFFPFSSYGMYKNMTSPNDFIELSLRRVDSPDLDSTLVLGDKRFFLQHRINQIKFMNIDDLEKKVKIELETFFKNEKKIDQKRYIFNLRYWKVFNAGKYNMPDFTLSFPLAELNK